MAAAAATLTIVVGMRTGAAIAVERGNAVPSPSGGPELVPPLPVILSNDSGDGGDVDRLVATVELGRVLGGGGEVDRLVVCSLDAFPTFPATDTSPAPDERLSS